MTAHRFDIGTAIFYFFKRFGENPGGAIWIALCQAAIAILLFAGALAIMAPAWDNLVQLILLDEAGQLTEEEAVARVLGLLGPVLMVMLLASPLAIAAALAFQGAWLRFLTRGEIKRGIPFRLGGDEIRLLGVNLLYIGLGAVLYTIPMAIFAVSGVGVALLADGTGRGIGAGIAVALAMTLLFLAIAAAVLLIAVRLASAPAMTVLHGRFRFFESWEASRGVFWHMLVSYIAVGALMMVISSVVGFFIQLLVVVAFLPMIPDFIALDQSGASADPQLVFDTLGRAFTSPVSLAGFVLAFLIAYLMQVMLEGMWHSVGAYNALRHAGGEGADLDAPVLGSDHPMGASPRNG